MFRVLSVAASAIALLGMTALSASAAPASHVKPKVHNFSIPGTTGISAWGNYSRSGSSVHITVCLKETSPKVITAVAGGTAFGQNPTHHQSVDATVIGRDKQACRSITTKDTAELWVSAISSTADGHMHIGKVKRVY
ncbi:MAG: hypothetical protein JO345_35235 [Streptosporangiaceae bacterium]|nr:hypothetical protein [Streptosporangiaceae bacterium]